MFILKLAYILNGKHTLLCMTEPIGRSFEEIIAKYFDCNLIPALVQLYIYLT